MFAFSRNFERTDETFLTKSSHSLYLKIFKESLIKKPTFEKCSVVFDWTVFFKHATLFSKVIVAFDMPEIVRYIFPIYYQTA